MNTKRIVLIDIDHTVSDAAWRDGMERGGEAGWEAYYKAGDGDEPHRHFVHFVNDLGEAGYVPIGLTARPEKWRSATNRWLIRNEVRFEEVLMRPEGDFRTSPLVKADLVRKRFPEYKKEVLFVMDDREDVIAMFKSMGITGLQVSHP